MAKYILDLLPLPSVTYCFFFTALETDKDLDMAGTAVLTPLSCGPCSLNACSDLLGSSCITLLTFKALPADDLSCSKKSN